MNEQLVRQRLQVLAVLASAVLLLWWPLLSRAVSEAEKSPYLTVSFLDVGQGDGIFIETPDGVQVLIDGGPDGAVVRELGKYMKVTDRTIDIVLSTHPDKDHVAGLIDVLERYTAGQIIMTENKNDTAASRTFGVAVEQEGAKTTLARKGQVWTLGASTTLTIFSPASDATNLESNAASIVAQLRYGDIEFLLTGDAPTSIEDYLASTYGNILESEVLKLGHHGSRTSSGAGFLKVVEPEYVVVSAGKNNTYGHPHSEVVERVATQGAQLFSTAEQGTVTFKTDGVKVWNE